MPVCWTVLIRENNLYRAAVLNNNVTIWTANSKASSVKETGVNGRLGLARSQRLQEVCDVQTADGVNLSPKWA